MISGVTGWLKSKEGDKIDVATASGLTYEIAVPVGVLERLPEIGAEIELMTILVVREDAWHLYGFDRDQDRVVFQKLLGASGVGPKLAMAILSTLGGNRVVRSVRDGDIGLLSTVPGVGKKTAEKLIVELRDRVKTLEVSEAGGTTSGALAEQAIQALVNLGYSPAESERAVRTSLARDKNAAISDLIRSALQQMMKR
jgi:Holliday junction DNA helicase RuvA